MCTYRGRPSEIGSARAKIQRMMTLQRKLQSWRRYASRRASRAASGRSERRSGRAAARTTAGRWLLRLPDAPIRRPDPGPRGGAAQLMEKFVIEGGVPLSGTMVPAGNKNGALPILACARPHRGRGRRRATCRASATSRRCSTILERDRRRAWPGADPTRSRCAPRAVHERRDRPRARRADPRLVPARRPAARPLSPRRDAAAGRRRDRPPPPRPAPRRVPRDGRDRRLRRRDRAERSARPAPDRRVHGRAVGDGDRERADGRRADAGHDRDRQRRVRAPRAGPRAHAREDGRRHPGHRLEPASPSTAPSACTAASTTSRPTTSRSAASWRSRASPAENCASRTRSPATCA